MLGLSSPNHVYRTVWNETLGGLTPVALAVALVCCAVVSPVRANPQGGVAIHGQATFDASQANTLRVTTQNGAGTNHSAINWQSFSIPAGSTTQIVQPSATSMSINRVVTNTPSLLFGTLRSNGQVVLVNQAGIAVGSGAVVDTAGFTASAVGMAAADAVAGRLRFGDGGFSSGSGALTVQGNIISRGGDVVLIAPSIEVAQSAVVEAQGGSVVLAAGQSMEVTGRGLEGITLQVQAPSDQALNLGSLKGDAVGIFAGTLKHSGQIQAVAATLEGGKVVLKASGDAYVEGGGHIDASSATAQGGRIEVLGNRVAVMDNAVLDASGATGGGTVLVGGDYQGKNSQIQNAQVSYFGANAVLKADATANGDGGKVVVWADDTTRAYGRISARGGAQGGSGGFVEVSGKRYLDFQGRTDTRAPLGKSGQLLLDPNDIHITNTSDAFGDASWTGGILSGGTVNPTITWATINAQAGTVTIQTNSGATSGFGDIYIDNSGTLTGPSTLELKAHRAINFGGSVAVNAGSADLYLVAGWNNSGLAVSSGAGKDISFGVGSSLATTGNIWMNAGNSVYSIDTTASISANTLTIGNTNGGSLPGGLNLLGVNMVNTLAIQADYSASTAGLTFKNGKALTIGAGAFGINGIVAGNNTQPIYISTSVGDLTVANAIVSDVLGGAPITLTATGALNINTAITSTFNTTPNGPIKLVAGSGGITSNSSGILTTNGLEIISAGGVNLTASNVVSTLAANVTGSGFSFANSGGYSVGVVGGTTGVTVATGDAQLTTSAANQLLTVSNNVQATSGNVIYIVDNFAHNAFTTTSGSPGKFVEVRPFTASTVIQFSSSADAPGFLRLGSGELSFSTPMLKLGHNSNTGGISFTQAVTPVNFNTLSLITGGSISQTSGSILTIANLNADGAAGVSMGTEANVITGKLGGHTSSGAFAFKTTGSVVLEQVDVNNGITSTSGSITLDVGGALSEGGTAVIDTPGTASITTNTGMTLNNGNTAATATLSNLSSGDLVYKANTASVSIGATNVGAGGITLSNVAGTGNMSVSNAATSSGNIFVSAPGSVTIGTASTAGNVSIASSAGAIVDGNSSALNVTGAVIDLSGTTGIASGTDSLEVSASTKVNAQSTSGSIYLAASGSLPVGVVSASSGTASLVSSSGNITDGNGATNNIVASTASLSAYSGIGVGDALETQLGTLSATTTMTGDIVIDNTGTLTLSSLSAGAGGRWLIYAAGPSNVVKGSVTSNFRHYGGTYSTYPSPTELGNGFIYASAAPTLSVATTLASGTAGNVFGGSPSAVYGYTLTGFADAEDNAGNIGLGGTAAFTPTISSSTNAGGYTVNYASGLTSSSGYTFAAGTGLAYTVTAAPITISTTNVSKTYDGGVSALGTATVTSGTLFGSDTISGGTFAFANKNVGAGNKTVSVTGVTVNDTNGGANYNVTYASNITSTITAATLTVGATASSKVYDGNTTATVVLSDNRVAGDVLSKSYSTADFSDSNVGTGKAVTVLGISVSGTDAGNYTYNTTATALADITAASVISPTTILANQVVAFSENLQTVAQESPPADGDEKEEARDAIVVEGEVCKP